MHPWSGESHNLLLIVDDTALSESVEATVIAIVFLLPQPFLRMSPC